MKKKNDGQLPLGGIPEALENNQSGRPAGMPSLAALRTETAKLGFPDSDADALFDSWLASGFRLKNGNKVRDWKACLRNWARNSWLPSQRTKMSTRIEDERAQRRERDFKRIKDGTH